MSHTNPLPELPRPFVPGDEFNPRNYYTADQMREYAAAAYDLGARSTAAQPADCGEAGHDEGRCGNAGCTKPAARTVETLTPDVVEQRLLTWRQSQMNRSGDRLALDDFMGQESIDDLIDFVCAAPAASGDSTPPSAPVQGDPSGALRPEPEAVGQDRVRAWSEAPGAERVWTCKVGGPVAGIPNGGDSPMRAAVSQAFEQITGFEARFIFSGWGGELTEGERAVVENRPAMPTFEVRVAGPDDVFSYSDELFALRHANSVNQAYLADRAKHPDSEVLCVATVHAAEPPQAASVERGD